MNGKVEAGESHEAALRREVAEELGIDVEVGGLVATVKHAYSHFRVTLNVYRCRPNGGKPRANSHTRLKWVRPADFDRYA
ncbi:MAG: NUDIX domain-containing protein, partial [Planctomycetes bacterium]|nr:NUDIX domain-containing protein [Planctomycetota bacterium]